MRGSGALAGLLLCAALVTAGCSSSGSGAHAAPAANTSASANSGADSGSVSTAPAGSASGAPVSTPRASVPAQSLCPLLAKIDAAASAASNSSDGLSVLRHYGPALSAAASAAPLSQRADLSVLTDAADSALSSGDLSALAADPVVTAGARLLADCGQNAPPTANPSKN